MDNQMKTERSVFRVRGRLKELIVIRDKDGNILHKVLSPLMIEFRWKDVLQVLLGSTIISIPVSYTQEAWDLGASLPTKNVIMLLMLSLTFVAVFVYFNYYKQKLKKHYIEFIKRVLSTYVLSFGMVALLLILIEQAPWGVDSLLAFKRTVIVALPASMSGTLADLIK